MTPDQQEAESRKYSNDVVIVLKLTSGRIALFNAARQLDRIIDEVPFDFRVREVVPMPTLSSRLTFNPNIELDI